MMDNNIILQQLLYNLQRNEYIDRPTSDTDIHVVPHNLPHSDVPVALYKDTDHLSFSNRGNVENTAREIGRIEKSFPMRQEIKFTRFPKEEVIRGWAFVSHTIGCEAIFIWRLYPSCIHYLRESVR